MIEYLTLILASIPWHKAYRLGIRSNGPPPIPNAGQIRRHLRRQCAQRRNPNHGANHKPTEYLWNDFEHDDGRKESECDKNDGGFKGGAGSRTRPYTWPGGNPEQISVLLEESRFLLVGWGVLADPGAVCVYVGVGGTVKAFRKVAIGRKSTICKVSQDTTSSILGESSTHCIAPPWRSIGSADPVDAIAIATAASPRPFLTPVSLHSFALHAR